jgi:chitosanase
MNIPCARCEEFRQRFEAAGYRVLGCTPGSGGMCALSYEWPGESAAQASTLAAAALGTPLAGLTPTQGQAARAIVNIFETDRVLGDYGQVTVMANDKGRLTYGRSQTSLTSGNLFKLVARYCANAGARFGGRLRAWLPQIQQAAATVDGDTRLHNLLRACADDPVMRETQDAFFDETYWQPALAAAIQLGLHTALGVAVVYDSHIHGSWGLISQRVLAEQGTVAQLGEPAWVAAYVQTRRAWLAGSSNPSLPPTVYRMDAFLRLIDQAYWGLPLPLVVRGHEISQASLSATPPNCYDGPQPGSRPLALGTPVLRGLDVRLVQLGLSDAGLDVVADGVFGQTSQRRVREYQIAQGLPPTGMADLGLIATLTGAA